MNQGVWVKEEYFRVLVLEARIHPKIPIALPY